MSASVPAQASQYVGEFCWRLGDPADPTTFALATLGVSLQGDDHFSVHGRITNFEGGLAESTDAADGNAEIIDGEIIMTLTNAFSGGTPAALGDFGYSVIQVRLDAATLQGTFRALTLAYAPDTGQFLGPEFEEGAAELLPGCTP